MALQFKPQFFTRPTTTSTPVATPVSSSTAQAAADDPKPKKYSTKHGVPIYKSPFAASSPLSNASQRYADIDWTHHEVITQDGERHKFGSPRFSE